MTYQPSETEIAEALGFESVEQMNEHQVWLNEQARIAERTRIEVARALAANEPINMTNITEGISA